MVARQVLDQDGALLDQGRVCVMLVEARTWGGKRGVGESDPRQAGDLLRCCAQELRGDLAVIAQLEKRGRGEAGYFARRRRVSRLALTAALILARRSSPSPGRPKRSLGLSAGLRGGSVRFHRSDIVAARWAFSARQHHGDVDLARWPRSLLLGQALEGVPELLCEGASPAAEAGRCSCRSWRGPRRSRLARCSLAWCRRRLCSWCWEGEVDGEGVVKV